MEINWFQIIFLSTATYLCIKGYLKLIYGYWKRRNVPYIKPKFPAGNLETPWAVEKGLHNIILDTYKDFRSKNYKHGGIFSILTPIYMPLDLDLLKNIMIKDFQHFVDRGVYFNEKDDPLSAHLFSIEGQKWRSLRTRLTPTFTSGKIKAMFQLVLDCGSGLEKELNKLWQENEPVNIKEVAASFTTNVIGSCAFGLDCNCFEDPNNVFRSISRKQGSGNILRAIRFMISTSYPDLARTLRFKLMPNYISDFYMGVIKDVVDHREAGNVKRNDFVDLLLEIKNGAKNKAESFTFNEIAAQAFVFFVAGFDTSSMTITLALHELAKNQDIQKKAREEVREIHKKYNGKLTYESINEMTYMQQVLDETLRKYPVVPILNRICTKDYKVPNEDLILKKGTKLMIPLEAIQNDPEYFPNPERFDPDRFTPEKKSNMHPCAYMPFGEGPRICIGMRFGAMQAKLGLALLIKDYKYTTDTTSVNFNIKSPVLKHVAEVLVNIEKI